MESRLIVVKISLKSELQSNCRTMKRMKSVRFLEFLRERNIK